MKMSLTKAQIASLEKAGLSKVQITKLADTIKEVESLSTQDIDKVVTKISTDQGFQRDFFVNPIIAIEKIGLKGKTGVNPKTT